MGIRVDYTGRIYGRLTVLPEYKRDNLVGNTKWKCKYECGNTTWVSTAALSGGGTRSCGCLRSERAIMLRTFYRPSAPLRREDGAAAFTTLLTNYSKKAKSRGVAWELNPDDFMALTKGDCWYCGCQPNQKIFAGGRKVCGSGPYIYNGIDRTDSDSGYTVKNCVSCCGRCNYMKSDMSLDDFVHHMRKILSHLDIKNA